MSRVALLLVLLLAAPVHAYERGNVLLESDGLWFTADGWPYALPTGWLLIHKTIPFNGPGHFVIPAPNQVIFHDGHTMSVWDGVNRLFSEPGKGYIDLFTSEAELGEIVPLRNGNFLVAGGGKLIEFNMTGRVGEVAFAEAAHLELLSDQCTMLYIASDPVVHRFDRCGGRTLTDFAALVAGEIPGAIRQLPNGDVLVADGSAILQFTRDGSLLRSLQFPGVTHLALTPDGAAFWAAGVYLGKGELRRFALDGSSERLPLGNPEMQTNVVPTGVSDLVVVGEWRSAQPNARSRAVRRSR